MSLVNVWHLRRVAETSAKPCEMICYKPTTSVLITPDNKVYQHTALWTEKAQLMHIQDHFYVCQGHLKDKGFASPIIDAAEAAARKKKEDMDREVELIKQEYEEKMKKEKKKKKSKAEEKESDKDKDKEDEKKEEEDDKKAEKEKDDKVSYHEHHS